MTVYIDVLFAINFSMDFLALFLTQAIMHRRIHKREIIFASAIGGAYGVFELVVTTSLILGAIINVLVSFLICFVAFKEKKTKRFTLMLIVFWLISASLGGVMSLLYSFLNGIILEYIKDYSYTTALNGARFFIVIILSVIFAMIFSRIYSSKIYTREIELSVLFKGKAYSLKGICDSGNSLTEPFSGKNVILVSSDSILGKAIVEENDLKKRYIPYQGIDKSGILKGIFPDKLIINDREISAIIAPAENKSFSGYEALIPIAII